MESRHHFELHGFIVGVEVVEKEGTLHNQSLPDYKKQRYTVVAISGRWKDDHIQLDSTASPWEIAEGYRNAPTKDSAHD